MQQGPDTAAAPWAPSIGLAVGLGVIGGGTWVSVREADTSLGVVIYVVLAVLLAGPALASWPLSRRRCTTVALIWLVIGVAGWSLFWVLGPAISLYVAPLAAMSALIGCGVGLD